MFGLSKIQEINEKNNKCSFLKRGIQTLEERYNITDAVFGLQYNRCVEWTKGFLVERKEFATLDECITAMKSPNQGIRVVNNEKYILGDLYANLSECYDNDKVFDIEFLEYIDK